MKEVTIHVRMFEVCIRQEVHSSSDVKQAGFTDLEVFSRVEEWPKVHPGSSGTQSFVNHRLGDGDFCLVVAVKVSVPVTQLPPPQHRREGGVT